jgi:hypothetical protein
MPPDNDKTDNIEITVLKPRLSLMRLLLGFGIYFQTPEQITLNSFLREFLALDQDYIDNRIQTMFMDGKPVDDPEKTLIKKDCEIGLSAAMPGVFGAAFRKQGIYSGLRRQTGDDEKKPENDCIKNSPAMVKVKLFNQVAADIGNRLLKSGVCMDAGIFSDFWKRNLPVLEKDCCLVVVNQEDLPPKHLTDILDLKTKKVRIRVKTNT